GVRVETRLIVKLADDRWEMSAYEWNEEQSNAVRVPGGRANVTVAGMDAKHDIPSQTQCVSCHGDEPDKILGFSALQLGQDGIPLTLASLIADGIVSVPEGAETSFAIPGGGEIADGFGTLHANCGHCHNEIRAHELETRGLRLVAFPTLRIATSDVQGA